MKIYQGSCHCQSVLFEVKCDVALAYQCDCSMCIRKSAKMVYAKEADYKILAGEQNLGMYQFNTNTAEHYFCKTCGIYTFHKTRTKPGIYGFNTGCLEGVNPLELALKTVRGSER